MRQYWIVLALGTLAVVGCQSSPPQKIEAAFDPTAAGYINKQGPARIEGHAFITRFDNRTMNASGQYVYLVPATAYARERFAKMYRGKKFLPATGAASLDSEPLYAKFTRTTKAESSGRFVFDNVAKGEYFVATNVQWKDSEDAMFSKGGAIFETVSVTGKPDEVIKLVVNGL